jgi:hypothetical protein
MFVHSARFRLFQLMTRDFRHINGDLIVRDFGPKDVVEGDELRLRRC